LITYGSAAALAIFILPKRDSLWHFAERTATRAYDLATGLVTLVTDTDNNVSTATDYDVFAGRTLV